MFWIPNAQLWCGICLKNRKVPTQSEVHVTPSIYIYIYAGHPPFDTYYTPSNTALKELILLVRQTYLSLAGSKWWTTNSRAQHRSEAYAACEWSSYIGLRTTVCMWPKEVFVWCLNTQCTTLMWHHIYRKPKSPHREREVHDAWYVLYVRPHSTRGIYVLLLYSTNQKRIIPWWSN
jgi:hypothetical protein